ncbi:uncharacterized protein LOC129233037 [Uloborus diversus]|uniref:uncharacterized protein LOC129233037 n=1 Tax=Uloborus diversus TaxID=327109 RepID=UPI0024096144|nr:uncharacterized protein LOC129233037 [Uloborus diversus]
MLDSYKEKQLMLEVILCVKSGKATDARKTDSASSASCPSIEEEEVFPKAEEKSESDSKKEEVTKRRSAKVKSSKREKARESRTPKGEDSGTKEEGRAAKGVEDSARREERRKSRNKEAEEHSLKNQMSSMEKSIRLGVSMELDSLRSLMYDQQAVLHKQLNRVLDECQRTQKTNAFLSVCDRETERNVEQAPSRSPAQKQRTPVIWKKTVSLLYIGNVK